MKKNYQILLIFLGIIIISGAIIFWLGGSSTKSKSDPHADMSKETAMPPAPDSTQLKEQLSAFENQLKTDPNNYDAIVGIGNSYYDLGNPPKAIEYYERALKARPNDALVMVDMGSMYRQMGDPDKALELFQKAISSNPNLPQAYFNLGMIYRMEKHDLQGAAKAWQKYLELDPNSEARQFLEEQIKLAQDSSKG
jgi:tetratricopeptide (TPR) repeat protein